MLWAGGALGNRAFGIPVRLGLAALPMALIGIRRHPFFPLVSSAWVCICSIGNWDSLSGFGLSALGLIWKGDRWMSVWIALVMLGWLWGHNYTSPSLLVGCDGSTCYSGCKTLEQWEISHRWGLTGCVFSLVCRYALHRTSPRATICELSRRRHCRNVPTDLNKDLSFSGEWTFRSAMSEQGIPPFDGTQSLVLTALNSGWLDTT